MQLNGQRSILELYRAGVIQYNSQAAAISELTHRLLCYSCNADVGKKGDRQYVTLGQGCSDTSVIIHEIGHVVGFWHEQNRPDRDKYVDILWDNIIDGEQCLRLMSPFENNIKLMFGSHD